MSKLSVVLRASTGAARPNLRVRVKNVDTDAYVLDTDDNTLVDNGDGSYTSATDVSAMVYSVYTGDTATLVNGYEERFHPGEGEELDQKITATEVTFTPSTAPTSSEGKVYYDETDNAVKVYNGSVWERISSGVAVDVRDYGAVGDGVTDDTAAIQAAIDACDSLGVPLWFPAARFLVSSTLTYKVPLRGTHGYYTDGTVILTTITDGTPVIKVSQIDYWDIRDIYIQSNSASQENFTGIQAFPYDLGGGSYDYSNRFYVSNVHVRNAATGFDLTGFIGRMDNCYATYCALGIDGKLMNACHLHLIIEQCNKSFSFAGHNSESAWGTTLQLVCEAASSADVTSIGSIDDCDQYTLLTPYCEYVGCENLASGITVGGTTECKNILFLGGGLTNKSGDAYLLVVDNVIGFESRGTYYRNFSYNPGALPFHYPHYGVHITSNATQVVGLEPPFENETLVDDSKQFTTLENYFPNHDFECGLCGWQNIYADGGSGITFELDTTNPYKGAQCLKIIVPSGKSATYTGGFHIRLPDREVSELAGRSVRLGAWVYIPDDIAYSHSYNEPANCLVRFGLTTDGTGGSTVYESSGNPFVPNGWQFFVIDESYDIPSDATYLLVNFYPAWIGSSSTYTTDGGEYLLVDQIVLCDGKASVRKMAMGDFQISPLAGRAEGVNWVLYGTQADGPPNASGLYYHTGHKFFYSDATHGALGQVVTTAGAGNACTWSDLTPGYFQASSSFYPNGGTPIAAGATGTSTRTVTGATIGDFVSIGSGGATATAEADLRKLNVTAFVTAADTVTIYFHNPTAGAIQFNVPDYINMNLRVWSK